MTWLVTGADGQLGRAFRRALAGRDDTRFVDRSACDLSNPASLADCLARETPSIIINCAAYTAVDAAEQDAQTAMRVNAQAVGDMARWAADRDALMVHFPQITCSMARQRRLCRGCACQSAFRIWPQQGSR